MWLRSILQILQSHDPPNVLKMTCHVCRDLLKTVSVFTSLGREITAIIPQILTAVIAASQQWRDDSFIVINSCIRYYSGTCGTFRETIYCWALLARCGTGGNQGIKYTEGWSTQCSKVISTLEHVAFLLYRDINDGNLTPSLPSISVISTQCSKVISTLEHVAFLLYRDINDDFISSRHLQSSIPLGQIPSTVSDKLPILTTRFETLTRCLVKLIRFKTLLLPYSKQIISMYVTELIWSHSSSDYGQLKLYSSLRGSVYTGLTRWFQHCKCLIETVNEEDNLLSEILHDCRPHVDNVKVRYYFAVGLIYTMSRPHIDECQGEILHDCRPHIDERQGEILHDCRPHIDECQGEILYDCRPHIDECQGEILHDCRQHIDNVKINSKISNVKSGSDPPPAKKKKKGGYQELSMGISSQRKVDPVADHKLTTLSLEALYQWIVSAGTQMKEKTYVTIMDFIINTSIKVSQNKQDPGIPYGESHCRLQLLHCLKALTMVPHPKVVCPVQCVISILKTASCDTCTQVSTFCSETLRYLDVIIHPRAPYFTKPKTINEEQSDKVHAQTSGPYHIFSQQSVPMSSLFVGQNWNQPQSSKEDQEMQVDSPIPLSSKANTISNSDSDLDDSSDSDSDNTEVSNTVQYSGENSTENAASSSVTAVSDTSKVVASDNMGDIGVSNTGKAIVQDSIDQDIIVRRGSIVLGVGEQLVDSEEISPKESGDAGSSSCITTKTTGEKTPVQHEDSCTTQSDRITSTEEGLGGDADCSDVLEERTDNGAPYSGSVDITEGESVKSSNVDKSGAGQGCMEKTEVDSMLSAFMDVDAEGTGD
ncbi:hypothetical protein FSP39_013222 [Pinctada imbricata]|uniref:Pre-rRNA-processing protein RIX1 N-terminal domain-containing protein n=1 Tax=Pinctada imbricata TaxID=66713 RepID=A0AA89BYM2_PINIB|nr:hypothetical protein FSP39_013222 [Pinctada imbricata]